MTQEEAKTRITSEFIARYDEWFADFKNLSDNEYAKKYGWYKSDKVKTSNQESYIYFQKYIFCGYGEFAKWLRDGYDRDVILGLLDEKFLSSKVQKWTTYCFISQGTAKQIYRDRRT